MLPATHEVYLQNHGRLISKLSPETMSGSEKKQDDVRPVVIVKCNAKRFWTRYIWTIA
jgi:hypothetical protein